MEITKYQLGYAVGSVVTYQVLFNTLKEQRVSNLFVAAMWPTFLAQVVLRLILDKLDKMLAPLN